MVCYAVPALAAVIHYGLRKKIPSWKNNSHHLWLNLLFLGGAIFGIIDHLWNGELFLIGKNIVSDLLLGITITLAIILSWGIVVALEKTAVKNTNKTIN